MDAGRREVEVMIQQSWGVKIMASKIFGAANVRNRTPLHVSGTSSSEQAPRPLSAPALGALQGSLASIREVDPAAGRRLGGP